MQFLEIVLSLLVPPLAVALRRESTGMQIALTFLLWLCGWFPGVIYALWLVTADYRPERGTPEYVARQTETRRAMYRPRARDRAARDRAGRDRAGRDRVA